MVYLDSTYSCYPNVQAEDWCHVKKIKKDNYKFFTFNYNNDSLGVSRDYSNTFNITEKGDTSHNKIFYNDSIYGILEYIASFKENIYLLGGHYYYDTSTHLINAIDPLLLKINNDGDTVWSKIYKCDSSAGFNDMGLYGVTGINDTTTVIYGWVQNISINALDLYSIYIDSLGNELKRIQYYSPYINTATKVIQTEDKGLLFVGTTEHRSEFVGPAAYLMKTDKNGVKQWEKDFRFYFDYDPWFNGDALSSRINDVLEISDGYIVCGEYDDTLTIPNSGNPAKVETDPVRRSWIAKLDKDSGNIIWSIRFGVDNQDFGAVSNYFNSIVPSGDGGFAACGVFPDTLAYGKRSHVLKVDSMGKKVWEYITPVDDRVKNAPNFSVDIYYLSDIYKIDNGYLITGVHNYEFDRYTPQHVQVSSPYVLTLDEGGCNTYNCRNIDTDTLNTDNLNLYPNPCEDYMILAYDSYPDTMVGLRIYNVLGELILNENIDDARHHIINTSSFAKGLYILQITQGGKVRKTRKFVKV